jgi:hypothetical protein
MSPTDLSKWALLTGIAWEHFLKDANVLLELVLAAHLADRHWAGVEAFTVAREAVIVAEEARAAAEAARALEATRAAEEATTVADMAEEAMRHAVTMLQAVSIDVATVSSTTDGPFLGLFFCYCEQELTAAKWVS